MTNLPLIAQKALSDTLNPISLSGVVILMKQTKRRLDFISVAYRPQFPIKKHCKTLQEKCIPDLSQSSTRILCMCMC